MTLPPSPDLPRPFTPPTLPCPPACDASASSDGRRRAPGSARSNFPRSDGALVDVEMQWFVEVVPGVRPCKDAMKAYCWTVRLSDGTQTARKIECGVAPTTASARSAAYQAIGRERRRMDRPELHVAPEGV